MVEQDRQELKEAFLLGILFHDVGKIVQRAQEDPTKLTHQEWGYEWLLKHLPEQLKHRGLIAQIAKLHHAYSPKKTPFEKLENLSVFHETNKSNLTLLAYQADNLSASERKPVSIEEQEYGAWQSDLALTSVFSKISLTHEEKKPKYNNCWRFLPGKVMSEIDINYPVEDTKLDRNVYKQILSDFENDLKLLGENLNINNALILYEKYCSYVPALTLGVYGINRDEVFQKHPDISLYDHSRIAVSMATCLWNYFESHPDYSKDFKNNVLLEEAILNKPDGERFLLIGGDLSGIQKFIYTISSWRALRNLKARSFFLELLTEHVIRRVIKNLNLNSANIIYSGGGRFYLLAQNSMESKTTLDLIGRQTNEWLFKEFKGKLHLNLTGIALATRTLLEWYNPELPQNLSAVWQKLNERLEEQKYRRFQDRLDELCMPSEPTEQARQCEVCHRDDQTLHPYRDPVEPEEEKFLCSMCLSLTKLGGELFRARFIQISERETSDKGIQIENSWYVPVNFVPEQGSGFVINSWDLKYYKAQERSSIWFGNYATLEKEASVEHYAKASYGEDRLGVLRMDVDHLGKIFIKGLYPEDASFSRYAALSRALNQFFKMGINILCNQRIGTFNPLNKKNPYVVTVVYSGGDDLFILGAWDDILELSININEAFRKYTCENPHITLSAGVVVQHPKMAVYQLARLSAEAEEASKDNGRDSITLFHDPALKRSDSRPSRTWKWSIFHERVQPIVQALLSFGIVKDKVFEPYLSKAFIFRMLQLVERIGENGKLVLPRVAWALARIQKTVENKIKSDNQMKKLWIEAVKNRFLGYETLEYLEVPLIWLDLISRTKGGE